MCCVHCSDGNGEAWCPRQQRLRPEHHLLAPRPGAFQLLALSPSPWPLAGDTASFPTPFRAPGQARPGQTGSAGICSGHCCLPWGCLRLGPGPEVPGTWISVYFLPGFCTHCGLHLEVLQWELWGLLWGLSCICGKVWVLLTAHSRRQDPSP